MTSLKGIGLRKKSYPDSMAEVGPICKKAEDLIPLLKVLVGPKVTQLKLDEQVRLDKLRIYYQESSGELRLSRMSPEMRAAMHKVVDHFKGITGNATKVIGLPFLLLFWDENTFEKFNIVYFGVTDQATGVRERIPALETRNDRRGIWLQVCHCRWKSIHKNCQKNIYIS